MESFLAKRVVESASTRLTWIIDFWHLKPSDNFSCVQTGATWKTVLFWGFFNLNRCLIKKTLIGSNYNYKWNLGFERYTSRYITKIGACNSNFKSYQEVCFEKYLCGFFFGRMNRRTNQRMNPRLGFRAVRQWRTPSLLMNNFSSAWS